MNSTNRRRSSEKEEKSARAHLFEKMFAGSNSFTGSLEGNFWGTGSLNEEDDWFNGEFLGADDNDESQMQQKAVQMHEHPVQKTDSLVQKSECAVQKKSDCAVRQSECAAAPKSDYALQMRDETGMAMRLNNCSLNKTHTSRKSNTTNIDTNITKSQGKMFRSGSEKRRDSPYPGVDRRTDLSFPGGLDGRTNSSFPTGGEDWADFPSSRGKNEIAKNSSIDDEKTTSQSKQSWKMKSSRLDDDWWWNFQSIEEQKIGLKKQNSCLSSEFTESI